MTSATESMISTAHEGRLRRLTMPEAPALTRLALVAGTVAATVGTAAMTGVVSEADPDLVRLIRGMAVIKGGLALAAVAFSYWRLARPVEAWRSAGYIGGTWLIAAGAVALWNMNFVGVLAGGLHVGLLGLFILAMTDERAIPSLVRRRR